MIARVYLAMSARKAAPPQQRAAKFDCERMPRRAEADAR